MKFGANRPIPPALYEDLINENGRLRNTEAKDEYGAVAAYLQELRPRLQTVELLTAKADRLDRIMNSPSWQLISRSMGIRRKFLDVVSLLSNRQSRPETNRADNAARAETSCNEAD